MPVITAMQEADEEAAVWGRPRQKFETSSQKSTKSGSRWLTPVIPATQEAEIRRFTIQSQPRQIVCESLAQKTALTKKGLVEWLKV
jgi:hypothetical protein